MPVAVSRLSARTRRISRPRGSMYASSLNVDPVPRRVEKRSLSCALVASSETDVAAITASWFVALSS